MRALPCGMVAGCSLGEDRAGERREREQPAIQQRVQAPDVFRPERNRNRNRILARARWLAASSSNKHIGVAVCLQPLLDNTSTSARVGVVCGAVHGQASVAVSLHWEALGYGLIIAAGAVARTGCATACIALAYGPLNTMSFETTTLNWSPGWT